MDNEDTDDPIIDEETHQLEEDYDTPFTPPDDVKDNLPSTHQRTDSMSDIDSHELYDEGIEGATETDPDQKGSNQ